MISDKSKDLMTRVLKLAKENLRNNKIPIAALVASKNGNDVIFDIDWQGTQQLREMARDDLVTVFILPPSARELEQRLRNRSKNTLETETQIRERMDKANSEMTHYSEYDYVLINSDIDDTIKKAQMILDAERLKLHRSKGMSDFVRGLQDGL